MKNTQYRFKSDQSAMLVPRDSSFINVGKRVASNNDNFIILGGNCEEASPVVRKYCQFLWKEISEIEKKSLKLSAFM